jgi:hypothetical protein
VNRPTKPGQSTAAANAKAAQGEAVPPWLAPLVFGAATVLLFREFFFQGGLLLGQDTYALSYFARDFYTTFVEQEGRFPLWDPLLFGGIPFVDGMHGDIFYPPSLAMFFMDARTMWGWKMVLHIFFAGVFAYLWLRSIGVRRGPALFGGLVFMMGADLVSLVLPGGDGKLFVSALAPLSFWLTERCVRLRRPADFALFALGIALVVFTSHMQLAYFTVWGVSTYFFFRLWQVWRADRSAALAGRLTAMFALAGVLGVGAAAIQFIPPLNYLREWSHRAEKTAEGESAYEYSSRYSLHPEEVVSLVVPEFVGDNAQTETRPGNTYWGRNSFKINNEYAGLVPLLLVPLLLVRRRQPETWYFVGLAVVSVLYGLGANTPLFRLFYLIPGVSLFRAPSLIIFLYGLSVATLGAMGLQRMIDAASEVDLRNASRRALWIVSGVFLLFALAESGGLVTGLWQSIREVTSEQAAALQQNLPNIRTGFWIAFALSATVAAVWEAVARSWIGAREAVIALALLAAIDLYRVDRPFIRNVVLLGESTLQRDPTLFEPDETIRWLQQQAAAQLEPFRVYDLGNVLQNTGRVYDHNVLAAHGLEQLAGHHGNEIGRYQTLVGGDGAFNVIASQLRLLDLANVRYFVSPQRLEGTSDYAEVHVSQRAAVYRNDKALPRAYLVGNVEVVPDEQAVDRLFSAEFAMATTAVLPEPLPAGTQVQPDPQGEVVWSERENDRYTLRVRSDRPALLVISENFYPAWKATVDGQSVPLLRANFTFRAVPVTAGEHVVTLHYQSESLRASAFASGAILTLLLMVAATALRRRGGEGGTGGTQ